MHTYIGRLVHIRRPFVFFDSTRLSDKISVCLLSPGGLSEQELTLLNLQNAVIEGPGLYVK